jgi:hypothetical protein
VEKDTGERRGATTHDPVGYMAADVPPAGAASPAIAA